MTDPKRLLRGDGTDFERLLLREGRDEHPSRALTRQMAVGLGVGAGILGYGAQAKAALGTWWSKALIGSTLAGATAVTLAAVDSPPSEAPVASPVAAQSSARDVSSPPEPVVAVPASEPNPIKPVVQTPPSRPGKARPGQPRPLQGTLAAEVRLIDRARVLIRDGRSAQAQVLLDSYQRKYPRGVLQHEARMLRAEARRNRDSAR